MCKYLIDENNNKETGGTHMLVVDAKMVRNNISKSIRIRICYLGIQEGYSSQVLRGITER